MSPKTGSPPFVLPNHHRVAIMLVGAIVNHVGKGLHQRLDQRSNCENIFKVPRHIADPNLNGPKVVVRPNIPPDFPNRIDEAGLDHLVDEPDVFTPISHERRKACGWEAFHNLATLRVQTRISIFPKWAACR